MTLGHAAIARRGLYAAGLLAGLAGCDLQSGGNLFYPDAAQAPTAAQTVPNVPADSRGVITYATYQVAVAQEGDTVASVAQRVGTSPEELAALNGLPAGQRLRAGERLALPDSVPRGDPGGFDGTGTSVWSPEIAVSAIDSAPGGTVSAPPAAPTPFQNGQTDLIIDPIRHRVEAGETAYSIARLYGVSVTALAEWNGLGPDMALRQGQELLIPVVSGANQIQSTVPGTMPGQTTPVAPPPSASAPLPDDIVTAVNPTSPDLAQYRTPPGGRLAPPVNGPVTKRYNPAPGAARSDGIGFSVPAGTPVRASGPGEVALVSESLGGLGTIVLIRHADDLMTVYGRVDGVTVQRGQQVAQGQQIGVVAARDNPELHFEVRRGTDSVDPGPYLGI
jgi:murein DD-endopeptidase MepM/ murein hydrolase activator NlpD